MRKRVLFFCFLVVVMMTGVRMIAERAADRHRHSRHDMRPWDPGRDRGIDNDRPASPDPPPWVRNDAGNVSPASPGDGVRRSRDQGIVVEDDGDVENPIQALLAEEGLQDQEFNGIRAINEGVDEGASVVGSEGLIDEWVPDQWEETGDATEGEEPMEPAEGVVINEIMYHPAAESLREPLGREFIELHNPTVEPVSLAGHRLTRGVDFVFPEVTLPAGAYLVVAANREELQRHYAVLSSVVVVGDWTGRLSNSGEEIRLEDGDGEMVDRVAYSDQGDWARRRLSELVRMSHRSNFSGRASYTRGGPSGWEWECEADGEGASLELITTGLSNNRGANWRPSEGGPTPGMPNTVRAADIAPLISAVRHHPAVPRPGEKVVVTAEIDDETMETVSAEVFWRVSTYRGGAAFEVAAMKTLASGHFAAVLPAQRDDAVVEFYVRATDGKAERLWPAGDLSEARANALFQVDSETNQTTMAFYRLIMTEGDRGAFGGYRYSNAQSNTTLIADDGSGPVIRYLCGTRVRGAGSRQNSPPPMRVNLPRDRPWDGATRMNLNSVYPWLQCIGMKIFQASGLRAPNMLPVQVRMNGEDPTRKSHRDYGAFVHAQPLDGDFLDEHCPDDSAGNLYKKVRPDRNWAWRRGSFSSYQDDGWLKQTNSGENDWSDLDRFLEVMNNAPRREGYLQEVSQVMDVDQWLRYLAVMALLGNGEGGIANGIDDDYAIYRGLRDTRFQTLPHDLDTILSIGEATSNPQHTLFDFVERGDSLRPLEWLFDQPEIRRRYFAQMSDLLETSFSEEAFAHLVDRHLGGWVPSGTLQRMQDFMALRSAYAAREVERAIGRRPGKRPAAAPTSRNAHRSDVTEGVLLNELLTHNVSAFPHRGGFPDVIELFNRSDTAASLGGMSLTDDAGKPGKFIFPEGTEIAPGAYLIVYADTLSFEGEYHTGFSIKREGETLSLFGRAEPGKERPLIDSITFGPQLADHSIGRGGSANAVWALTKPSPGEPNESVTLGTPDTVRINEWLAAPEARFSNDYIELVNLSERPVCLGGTALTTDYVGIADEHRLPLLSFIAGRGFLVFESLGKRSERRHPCDLPFRLPSHHGWIRLVGSNGVEMDKVHYHCQRPDIAEGRLPSGGTEIVYLTLPTPGEANGEARDAPSEVRSWLLGLRVSEMMYHPQSGDLEFIEIANIGEESLSLAGVRFTDGIEFEFGEDARLEPGACLLLVEDREAFAAVHGDNLPVVGEYSGKLSNGGEAIELSLPTPSDMAIQRFEYDDRWYAATDGGGASLTVRDLRADVKLWETLTHWRPSQETGGTPGVLAE